MKTARILAVLVAAMVISSVLFAAPAAKSTSPTTDGAIWGGKVPPPTNGAIWGGNSAGGGNKPTRVVIDRQSGVDHKSLADYLKSLAHGLGLITEGAIWG
ncbi:MAG TPA: hypothetical protein VGR67_09065 [Candidatus Polarisedimenticolia bacterium]|jgi:hypothetical protein|nr:hypothetical protein [Candidatus Polarisedimenticolia bacterium]